MDNRECYELKEVRRIEKLNEIYYEGKFSIIDSLDYERGMTLSTSNKYLYVKLDSQEYKNHKNIDALKSSISFYSANDVCNYDLYTCKLPEDITKEINRQLVDAIDKYKPKSKEWVDARADEQWAKFRIKTEYSTEEYVMNCSKPFKSFYGNTYVPVKDVDTTINMLYNEDGAYYENKAHAFLSNACFCDAYEIIDIYILPQEEVLKIHEIYKEHETEEDYGEWELSNDYCYHSKGTPTVNDLIYLTAKAPNELNMDEGTYQMLFDSAKLTVRGMYEFEPLDGEELIMTEEAKTKIKGAICTFELLNRSDTALIARDEFYKRTGEYVPLKFDNEINLKKPKSR